jgi:signal peptidase I
VVMSITGCHWAIEKYVIASQSMYPLIQVGQEVMVDRAAYAQHEPERGDIVLFSLPAEPVELQIRRIIGLPGETVEIQNSQVLIDGVFLEEPYVSSPISSYSNGVRRVLGPDEYFVMGDNRANSRDSRSYGPIPRSAILGEVIME